MLKKLLSFFQGMTYQSLLEDYIDAKNPQNAGDVERYALEFQRSFKNWS